MTKTDSLAQAHLEWPFFGDAHRQLARELEAAAEEAQELPSPPPVRNPEPIVFTAPPPPRQPAKGAEARLFAMEYNIRRNDPCPCGSALRYRDCHGAVRR